MNDTPMERRRDDLILTTARSVIDLDATLALLRTTNWAATMQREQLARCIEESICFSVLRDRTLVGFARVISDLATFAYLTDVVVDPGERGRGLGIWLVEQILSHPQLQRLRRFSLLTSDSQTLYARFGFTEKLPGRLTYMERR